MKVRIWTTGLIPEKIDDYLVFANTHSIPMFKKQTGILGVKVLIKDDKSLVLTYWKNIEDVAKMENNILYKETVNRILKEGFLKEPQQVEIFDAPIHFEYKMEKWKLEFELSSR